MKIDIPWLNTVIRERTNREFGAGLRQRVFARADLLGWGLSPVAPLANRALRTPPARLAFRALGIDGARPLPAYERLTFLDWWRGRPASRGDELKRWSPATSAARLAAPPPVVARGAAEPAGCGVEPSPQGGKLRGDAAQPANRVALFVDCFMNHNLPEVGRAAVEVLERAGIEVLVAHNSCCGRPAMSQGLLDTPRRWAVENLAGLGALIDGGCEIVCIEPSCLSALRDDYRPLLGCTAHAGDARLEQLERHAFEITEYLVLLARAGRLCLPLRRSTASYVVHGHCHQKSLGIGATPAELLRLVPGVTVHEVEALCCGLVGSFGYKREYAQLARAIGARLFARLAEHEGDVVACGISCRSQIAAGTGRRVLHPVEVLAAALLHEAGPPVP